MKKIMFNDKYGLTAAVLVGTKTQTRRIIPQSIVDELYYAGFYGDFTDNLKQIIIKNKSRYKVGEKVAVAQSYSDIFYSERRFESPEDEQAWNEFRNELRYYYDGNRGTKIAWKNKMFVRAEFMPHKIKITDIRVQRLQDISENDCLAEGIIKYANGVYTYLENGKKYYHAELDTPQKAYAALIDKISGKGTWERNPWVFVYTFSLSNSDSNKEV
jgi:hypothetical protein